MIGASRRLSRVILDRVDSDWKLALIQRVAHNRSPPGRLLWSLQQQRSLRRWLSSGQRAPMPELAKHEVIREYARQFGLRTLIETGTFLGDSVYALRREFDRIISIELDQHLADAARRRFARDPRISILIGDSAAVLPEALSILQEPALFWLDAHWSGGVTAHGDKETPLLEEVTVIANHPIDGHVVLIDDAQYLGQRQDYPSLKHLRRHIAELRPVWRCYEANGIVRFTPRDV